MVLVWIAAIFILYWLLSYFFLRYPIFKLSKKERVIFPIEHVGHRGGGGDAPENTLKAFRKGWLEHNVDVLELDVRLTKDNVIVILHDPGFERISGVEQTVNQLLYDELPLVDGEKVCKFEELLADKDLKDAPICLDFKVHNNLDLIRRVYEMMHSSKRLDKFVWGSFDERTRLLCVNNYPEVPTFLSMQKTISLYLQFCFGLVPFIKMSNKSHGVLLMSVLLKREWFERVIAGEFARGDGNRIVRYLIRLLNVFLGFGFFTYLVEHPLLIRHLIDRGYKVCFWTVNTDEDMVRVRKSGASGFITDFPSKKFKLHNK